MGAMGVATAERVTTPPQRKELMVIANELVPAADGRVFYVETPARRGEIVAEVPRAGAADVDRAVKAAQAAFPKWRDTHWKDRARALYKIADAIEALIASSQSHFEAGERELKMGHLERAREEFDRSVDVLLESAYGARTDDRMREHFDRLIDPMTLSVLDLGGASRATVHRPCAGNAGRDSSAFDDAELVAFRVTHHRVSRGLAVDHAAERANPPDFGLPVGHGDIRLTTRYDRGNLAMALFWAALMKLAWLLEHQYSTAGLSFAGLKGQDAARVQVRSQAAERAGCAAHLGIVHIGETGPAEPHFDMYGYGAWRSGWQEDEESDEEEDLDEEKGAAVRDDFDVIEVSDAWYYVDHWVDAPNRSIDFGRLPLNENELLPAGALDDAVPDEQRLTEANAFDFDDLIMTTVNLLQVFPDVAEHYRRRFRHVLVDEYQDTNHAQYVLVRELVGKSTYPATSDAPAIEPAELCVVGWGSTWAAIDAAVQRRRRAGDKVAWVHLVHLNPLPSDLGDVLARANQYAHGLRALGLQAGDGIAAIWRGHLR